MFLSIELGFRGFHGRSSIVCCINHRSSIVCCINHTALQSITRTGKQYQSSRKVIKWSIALDHSCKAFRYTKRFNKIDQCNKTNVGILFTRISMVNRCILPSRHRCKRYYLWSHTSPNESINRFFKASTFTLINPQQSSKQTRWYQSTNGKTSQF